MGVLAVVVVRSRGGRPDVLAPLRGEPILLHAVRGVVGAEALDRVVVAVDEGRHDAVLCSCRGLPVDVVEGTTLRVILSRVRAHGGQRAAHSPGDAHPFGSLPEVIVVHDAHRPLAPSTVVTDVVQAVVDSHPAAVPVLPLSDTVKVVGGDGLVVSTPDRSALRVVQTPQAFRVAALSAAELDADPLTVALVRARAGRPVHTLPGHPLSFPVVSEWDLELAELLLAEETGVPVDGGAR